MPKQEKQKKTSAQNKTQEEMATAVQNVPEVVAQPAQQLVAPTVEPVVQTAVPTAEPVVQTAAPTAEPVVQTAGGKRKQRPTTDSAAANPKKKQKTIEPQTSKRHFKCIMINTKGEVVCTGRYSGRKPKQAGNKACTRIFKNYKDKGIELPEKIIFGIHECTRNTKKKKKYFYVGTRAKLKNPLAITINKDDPSTGKHMVIPYNFNNIVKKLTDTTCQEYGLLSKYDAHDDKDAPVIAKPKKQGKKSKSKKQQRSDADKTVEKVVVEKKTEKKADPVVKVEKKPAKAKPIKVVAKKKKSPPVQKTTA